jgi:hypothetical protein
LPNGRPRTCPGSFNNSTSNMVIPLVQPVAIRGAAVSRLNAI